MAKTQKIAVMFEVSSEDEAGILPSLTAKFKNHEGIPMSLTKAGKAIHLHRVTIRRQR